MTTGRNDMDFYCEGCGARVVYEPDTNAFVCDECTCGDEPEPAHAESEAP